MQKHVKNMEKLKFKVKTCMSYQSLITAIIII